MKIGFIGLGIMGKPMAKNLLKAGYEVWVHNRSRAAMDELAACGAHPGSRQELGQNCDVIITMLPNGPQVQEVMLGADAVASYMHAGQIFVDCSSISPVVSKEIAAKLAEKGIEMLDAPVSGGEPKAIDGTLSFMVGGKQAVFDRCRDMLLTMGASAVRCGDVGAGNTTKLANQIIVACNIQAVAEAFTLAQKDMGREDFTKIPGGLPGVETRGELIYSYGVAAKKLSLAQMCRVLSENPAKLYGLYPRKGVLAPGSDADIVIYDPGDSHVIRAEDCVANVDYNPYEGFVTAGGIREVWLRGRKTVENGKVLDTVPAGMYLARGKCDL